MNLSKHSNITAKKYLNNKFNPAKVINGFDELPIWAAPFGLKLLDAVKYKEGIIALDIGFGTGFPLIELAMRLGNSSVVYGIDPWKEAIERAKEKIDCYGVTNIKIMEGIAEAIPLADNFIDLIVSNNGINNVDDMDKALSECARVLKPGGQFVFTMNLDQSMFEFYGQMEYVLKEMNLHDAVKQMHEHIAYKRPSVDTIKILLNRHGFITNDLVYDQFNYQFTNGTAMLNHYFIRLAFMDSWLALLPSDRATEIFDQIETRLNEHAKNSDGLKLSIPFILMNVIKKRI